MMKLFKRAFSLFFVLIFIISELPVCSFAAEDPVVKFNGFESEERFDGGFRFENFELTQRDLFPNFKNVMPGDVKTQRIVFRNACHSHEGLTLNLRYAGQGDNTPLMNEFLDRLTLEIRGDSPAGEILYSGSAGNDFGDRPMGTLMEGPAGGYSEREFYIKLTVPEDLENKFMNISAGLDWAFVVSGYGKRTVTVIVRWETGIAEEDYIHYALPAQLYMDGHPYLAPVILNRGNTWTHVFRDLAPGHDYKVVVDNIPHGYNIRYTKDGTVILVEADDGGVLPPDSGSGGGGSSSGDRDIFVKKLWADDKDNRPSSVEVELFEDNRLIRTAVLKESSDWSCTFRNLKDNREYFVREKNIPLNYDASYEVSNDKVTITNTENGLSGTGRFTVSKKWDKRAKKIPPFVYVTLYNGDKAVETIKLSEENSWKYTWEGLNVYGRYSVKETAIPQGYTPVYKSDASFCEITNVIPLPQTGNNNLLPVLLILAGIVLILLAFIMKKRKDKKNG